MAVSGQNTLIHGATLDERLYSSRLMTNHHRGFMLVAGGTFGRRVGLPFIEQYASS